MAKKTSKRIQLSPGWWVAYGVVIGLAAAGLILLLASPQRGQPIALRPAPTNMSTTDVGAEREPTSTSLLPTASFPININTATLQQLQQLPNIGPTLAQAIIDYRNSHGPFSNIDDIQNVVGIGNKTFDGIKSLINIGEP